MTAMKGRASRSRYAGRIALLVPVFVVLLGGCTAARRPTAEITDAEYAVRRAQASNDVYRYALAELNSAQHTLALAREAAEDGDYAEAERLAELARVQAELAEARAGERVARQAAVPTTREVEVVPEGGGRSVVIERSGTTPPSSSGIVLEREPPRGATTTTTVIERPLDSDSDVDEETTDRTVVVVPE